MKAGEEIEGRQVPLPGRWGCWAARRIPGSVLRDEARLADPVFDILFQQLGVVLLIDVKEALNAAISQLLLRWRCSPE
jgi:hypothetical protein